MTDEILTVRIVSKDGGCYICHCPHCGEIITLDGDELTDVQGEQYRHHIRTSHGESGCGGWLEISDEAHRVRELPEHNSGVKTCGRCGGTGEVPNWSTANGMLPCPTCTSGV